jgi:hypothetical protein
MHPALSIDVAWAIRIRPEALERTSDLTSRGRRSAPAPGLNDRRMATPELDRDVGALVGRQHECAAIDHLLEASARGEEALRCYVARRGSARRRR